MLVYHNSISLNVHGIYVNLSIRRVKAQWTLLIFIKYYFDDIMTSKLPTKTPNWFNKV